MNPPLVLMAHFAPDELAWCPDCSRISNSTQQCNACANRLGLLPMTSVLGGHAGEVVRGAEESDDRR